MAEKPIGFALAGSQVAAIRLALIFELLLITAGRASKSPLLSRRTDKAAVLISGNIDQLPSVGPRQVLADIISSGAVHAVRLTEAFRLPHRVGSSRMPIQGSRPESQNARSPRAISILQSDIQKTPFGHRTGESRFYTGKRLVALVGQKS